MTNWIKECTDNLVERDYESSCKVWNGKDILSIFHDMGITNATFPLLKGNLAAVVEKEEKTTMLDGQELVVKVPILSPQTQIVLQGLFLVLDYLFRENNRFAEDYRVALQQSYTWTSKQDVADENGFFARPKNRRSIRQRTLIYTLNFWCLNPAVAFSELSGNARSIVLTSGTLSPMGSFSSELGVKFSIQLEASHVIQKSQLPALTGERRPAVKYSTAVTSPLYFTAGTQSVREADGEDGNQGKHRVTKRGPALSNPMFTLVTGIVGRWRAVCVTALQRPNSDAAVIRIVVWIAAASFSVK
ncbi:unnamed protein product, partial [Ranitomeya imitator]